MDARDKKLDFLQKAAKTLVAKFIKKFPNEDFFSYYKNLLTKEESITKYAGGKLNIDQVAFLCDYSSNLLDKKKFEIEDSAPLIYLKSKLFGFGEEIQTNNVVIDEAQDFSVFQLYTLKQILDTSRFTILGDLSQGIYSYRGTDYWPAKLPDNH